MSREKYTSADAWRDASLKEWQAFRKAFPIEKLSEMTLDDYLIGMQKQTFCWWIENGTYAFAAINGAYSTKYGVFKNRAGELQVAPHLKKISPEVVFERIKTFIVSVAQKAAARDLDGLVKLAATPAKTRCITPIVFWKVAVLYQPIDAPFLVPVCGMDAIETLGEKNGERLQLTFQNYRLEENYWSRSWNFMEPLRTEKNGSEQTSILPAEEVPEAESDEEAGEYSRLLRILRNRKNLILQGAPGTGKTYLVPELVTRLCGEISGSASRDEVLEAYKRLAKAGRVVAVTFHPSMDYDDFVEGWKPDPHADGTNGIRMKLTDGVFKRFCDSAGMRGMEDIRDDAVVWKVSLQGARENPIRRDCLLNNRIRIAWEDDDENATVKLFTEEMKIGDIVFSCYDSQRTDAIGIVSGECEMLTGETAELGYCRSRAVRWLWTGEPVEITSLNEGKTLVQRTVYRLNSVTANDVRTFLLQLRDRPYVFVIDEFNRGNVPKIFGELITLIEADKREGEPSGMSVHLAYDAPDAPEFSVPANVYILGTMNTADRSIAPIDYAMRRRFAFERILPHALADENFDEPRFESVSRLFVQDPKNPTERSEHLCEEFDPADVWIGHSYFLAPDGELTRTRWDSEIRPLLNEYLRDGVLKPSALDTIKKIEKGFREED